MGYQWANKTVLGTTLFEEINGTNYVGFHGKDDPNDEGSDICITNSSNLED